MSNTYQSLAFNLLHKQIVLNEPAHMRESSVSTDEPAIMVMTDFRRIRPLSIGSNSNIEMANQKMINCGVRLLFVTNPEGATIGLITTNDILGEKPVQYIKEHGGHRYDILVSDIMTRNANLDAVNISEVAGSKVGDIVETIKQSGRHHVLVVEENGNEILIRGMFSKTQVSKQIGEKIIFSKKPLTFAELEHALEASA